MSLDNSIVVGVLGKDLELEHRNYLPLIIERAILKLLESEVRYPGSRV